MNDETFRHCIINTQTSQDRFHHGPPLPQPQPHPFPCCFTRTLDSTATGICMLPLPLLPHLLLVTGTDVSSAAHPKCCCSCFNRRPCSISRQCHSECRRQASVLIPKTSWPQGPRHVRLSCSIGSFIRCIEQISRSHYNFNRRFAEQAGYFESTSLEDQVRTMAKKGEPVTFYDSVAGKALFVAPVGRSADQFIAESKIHGAYPKKGGSFVLNTCDPCVGCDFVCITHRSCIRSS
jgi:hypothetical protein